jgi:hypothetical protein
MDSNVLESVHSECSPVQFVCYIFTLHGHESSDKFTVFVNKEILKNSGNKISHLITFGVGVTSSA